jgi:hypothetical protein
MARSLPSRLTARTYVSRSSASRAGATRTQKGFTSVAWLLAAFALAGSQALAQTAATISGVVSDPSGAAVPGARVTLTNQDTTAVLGTQRSDVSGSFSFQAVPAPGNYSFAVQADGFAAFAQKDIVVTAGERRSVGTLSLSL